MKPQKRKIRLSEISLLHYIKLTYRTALFLAAALFVILKREQGLGERFPAVYAVIWLIFTVEMVFRFFPSGLESMGCQKQFARNYRPRVPAQETDLPSWKQTLAVVAAWLLLNGAIGALYFLQIINRDILLLICLAYSVCDMVCILFFCPFQTWFLKNKCCGSCRIYNWDYAMMFTPLAFIPQLYSWSLLGLSLVLLVKWEIIYHRYPERFSEGTNENLDCAHCREKLCSHKTQLRKFLKSRNLELLRRRMNPGDGKSSERGGGEC